MYNINIDQVDNFCNFPAPPWICPKFNLDFSIHEDAKSETAIEQLKAKAYK